MLTEQDQELGSRRPCSRLGEPFSLQWPSFSAHAEQARLPLTGHESFRYNRGSEYLLSSSKSVGIMAKKGGKGKKKLETVFLVCEETGDYNYTLRRKSGGEKIKVKKYSPRLRRRTVHTEKKK